ncbi:MAG TPA: mobilization protein, partial [Flavobacteriaceae bacterium]|nr:mobilization protein [Flavobacteriaceae bacterium]
MIGKGRSISQTSASIAYGWNQEKNAEIVLRQHLFGETPSEISKEFK